MSESRCDLLVVGLGPVGDVLAALARLHGLDVIAIDREPDKHHLPRAAVFDDEVMRIFQMVGVSERILPFCRVPDRYQFLTAAREVLLEFPIHAAGRFGWAETYALHQPAVEQTLRDRLAELGVDVRLGTAFEALAQDGDGVSVSVRGPSGGASIRARYVVGCDGAWSPVRESVGVRLSDYSFDEPWLVLDTIIAEPGPLPVVCQQICDPQRPVTHLAMSGSRFRWEFMLKPGETAEEMLRDDTIRTLLAPWNCFDRMVVERKAVYRFHALVAEQWRRGRVLLAGDAAHQMPPFAGQGMCSGIRDAANLAWKLAAVVRGAPDSLLDSYEMERAPHVRAIIETAIAMGRVVCVLDPQVAAARDAEMLSRKATGEQQVSIDYPPLRGGMLREDRGAGTLSPQPMAEKRLDDLIGLNAALIGRGLPPVGGDGIVALDLDDPALKAFAPPLDAWLAGLAAPAALIRPDRHVFGASTPNVLIDDWHARLRAHDRVEAYAQLRSADR